MTLFAQSGFRPVALAVGSYVYLTQGPYGERTVIVLERSVARDLAEELLAAIPATAVDA